MPRPSVQCAKAFAHSHKFERSSGGAEESVAPPSTNTLPIRRLRLAVGASKTIQAAWLRFPDLEVVKAAQTYTRLDELTYRYASGTFQADLAVDDEGLVTAYGPWRRTALAVGPDDTEPLDARR